MEDLCGNGCCPIVMNMNIYIWIVCCFNVDDVLPSCSGLCSLTMFGYHLRVKCGAPTNWFVSGSLPAKLSPKGT